MKTCINDATTMPYSSDDDIKVTGKAGFEGVEIWRDKLDRYLQDRRKEELKDYLSFYNLGVSAIWFLDLLFFVERSKKRRL